MNLVEAKEIMAKAHLCHTMPVFDKWCVGYKDCENCQLYVSDEQEQEAYNYLYSLLAERSEHESCN